MFFEIGRIIVLATCRIVLGLGLTIRVTRVIFCVAEVL